MPHWPRLWRSGSLTPLPRQAPTERASALAILVALALTVTLVGSQIADAEAVPFSTVAGVTSAPGIVLNAGSRFDPGTLDPLAGFVPIDSSPAPTPADSPTATIAPTPSPTATAVPFPADWVAFAGSAPGRPIPYQSSSWLALKRGGRIALSSGRIAVLPPGSPLADPQTGAPLPAAYTLDPSWARWIIEPVAFGVDAKGGRYRDLNYWAFCAPGAATVIMFYWQQRVGYPNVTTAAGYFVEPYDGQTSAAPSSSPSPSPSASASPSGSPSPSVTPTPSPSPGQSPSHSPSPSPTLAPTPSATPATTPTPPVTSSPSPTPAPSPSAMPSSSPSAAPSASPSAAASPSASASAAPTAAASLVATGGNLQLVLAGTGPTFFDAAGNPQPLGAYWSGSDRVNGYTAHARGYLVYLATAVQPPGWTIGGVDNFVDINGLPIYPTNGAYPSVVAAALNWEASNHRQNGWINTWYTYVRKSDPNLARDFAAAVHADVGRDHVAVIADVDAFDLPNWQSSPGVPAAHVPHSIAVIGYDDVAGTYTYLDTCGTSCNRRAANQNGGIYTIAAAQLVHAMQDQLGGGFIW